MQRIQLWFSAISALGGYARLVIIECAAFHSARIASLLELNSCDITQHRHILSEEKVRPLWRRFYRSFQASVLRITDKPQKRLSTLQSLQVSFRWPF
jgi:hypothetical protein